MEPPDLGFDELIQILYTDRHKIVELKHTWDKETGEASYVTFLDLTGTRHKARVTDPKAIEHLQRFKKTHAPATGPALGKVRDLDQHWKDWEFLVEDAPKKVRAAQKALLAQQTKIDFPWARLLHEALQDEFHAFSEKYLPLKQRHHDLVAHIELAGYKAVVRSEDMAKNSIYKEAHALVQDTLGFVSSEPGFVVRLLDLPGGPPHYAAYVANHLTTADEILKGLSTEAAHRTRSSVFQVMAVYGNVLEALRPALLVLAKAAERNRASDAGSTKGSLTELVEFLTDHPTVGARYSKFLDAQLRHHFAHAWYRLEGNDILLLDPDDISRVVRRVPFAEMASRVDELVIRFAPVAFNGALLSYYADLRLMMQTIPYIEWLVGIANAKT